MGGRQTEDLEVPGLKYALKIPGPREEFFLISHHLDFFFLPNHYKDPKGQRNPYTSVTPLESIRQGASVIPWEFYEENKRPLSKFSVDSTE